MAKLREQHRMFADKFIECRNAKQAYLYVYPDATERTAEVNGSRLRKAEDIDAYIREQMDEISHKPNIASAEEVLEFLSGMMSNPEAKDTDRIRCAELLGKRYALYSDKVQVDGAVPVMFAGEDDLSD